MFAQPSPKTVFLINMVTISPFFRQCIVLVLLLATLFLHAQDQDRASVGEDSTLTTSHYPFASAQQYIDFGMGWGYWYGRDKGMLSSLIQKGNFGHLRLAWERHSEQTVQQFKLEPLFGVTSSAPSDINFLTPALNANYNFQHLVMDFPQLNTGLYAGAAFDLLAVGRFSPAYVNHLDYEFMNSLSIATTLNRTFYWFRDHPLQVSWELTIPVVSNVVRPLYAQSAPGEFVLQTDADPEGGNLNTTYASFGSLVRVKSNIAVTYYLANGNGLELGYTWDYYRFDKIPDNTVNAALHRVYFALMFNL